MTAPAQTTDLVLSEQPGVPAPLPQYFRGFDGAAMEPFPEQARKVLAEAVNPRDVEIKPDGIMFLPGVAYRRILTRAFGAGGWAILPRSPARVMGNLVVYHGVLVCLGRFVAEATGECFYREGNSNMSYASCVEGAKTDALSRCCKDLGIATELWDANWREDWKPKYATKYQATNKRGETEWRWKLKDRVSKPHDLMAGAGGVEAYDAAVPSAAPPPSPSASQPTESERSATADRAAAPGSGGQSSPQDGPDAGEPATPEQLEAVTAEIRRRKWTRRYVGLFLDEHFGVGTIGALSSQQASRALVEIMKRPAAEVSP